MTRLQKLIEQICPDGVGHKQLGEVAKYATERVDAQTVNADTYVGVDNLLPDKRGKTTSNYVPVNGKLIQFVEGDILIGNIRPYLKKIWRATYSGGTNGDVLTIRPNDQSEICSVFLYYILSSDAFFLYDMQNAKGAKMPRGDKAAVLRYRLPVPPLEVQQEIVRILDQFTQLTAELTAELTARKQQYEYYRANIFNKQKDVTWTTLGDICKKVTSGGTPKAGNSDYYGGTIPWLRTQEIDWHDIYDTAIKITDRGLQNSSAKWISPNCVIVAMYGATAAKVAINKIPLTTNQACCNLEIDETKALYRYVFHWICKEYRVLKALGQGSQSNLNAQTIKQYKIPLPPLPEQRRIVSILDRFDALCNNLTSGLPAEIAARQKQYEYYRDKLLTFPERKEADA